MRNICENCFKSRIERTSCIGCTEWRELDHTRVVDLCTACNNYLHPRGRCLGCPNHPTVLHPFTTRKRGVVEKIFLSEEPDVELPYSEFSLLWAAVVSLMHSIAGCSTHLFMTINFEGQTYLLSALVEAVSRACYSMNLLIFHQSVMLGNTQLLVVTKGEIHNE